MKKLLLIVAIMFAGLSTAMAQTEKGEMGAGLNLLLGTETGYLGVGAKYRYSLTDEFRAEASLEYFFKHKHQSLIDGDINFEYILPVESANMVTYPILGLGFGSNHQCFDESDKDGKPTTGHSTKNVGIIGFNAGWGAEYNITDKAAITAEVKYQFFNKNCTQLVLGVGLVHKF